MKHFCVIKFIKIMGLGENGKHFAMSLSALSMQILLFVST